MKKTDLIISIFLISALPLFASPSWIGVQTLGWQSDQTATVTYMGVSSTSSGTDEGVGLIISGSLYPESNYGLGFQFGALKATNGEFPSDSDAPLAWRGVLTTQYGSSISEYLAMEFGTGILYEELTDTYTSGGLETHLVVKSISLYSSTSLVLQFSRNLSLVGGLSMTFPLGTKAEVTKGGITTKPDMHVTGYSFEALIGVALSL